MNCGRPQSATAGNPFQVRGPYLMVPFLLRRFAIILKFRQLSKLMYRPLLPLTL